jgi:hypothetical protein
MRRLTIKPPFFAISLLLFLSCPLFGQQPGSSPFDQTLEKTTATFYAVNPYTNVAGEVTVTVEKGIFHVKRTTTGRKAGWTAITGAQEGSFEFKPYDTSQPSYSGKFKFELAGEIPWDRHNDLLPLNFIIKTTGSDASESVFCLAQTATVNEYGASVAFGELTQPNNQQP